MFVVGVADSKHQMSNFVFDGVDDLLVATIVFVWVAKVGNGEAAVL